MASLKLQILEPAHGANIAAPNPVRLRGELVSPAPTPLFYKWYSSLKATPILASNSSPTNAVILVGAGPNQLSVGTHVLTFAAKDVEGDDKDSIPNVRNAGFTGGKESPQNPEKCHINVLLAVIKKPVTGNTLSKASSTLEALAPASWGKEGRPHDPPPPPPPQYVLDPGYHAINRVRYIWIFTPAGTPAGPASPRLALAASDTTFDIHTDNVTPLVRYRGTLPPSLGTGNHTLILRVEDMGNPAAGHEASVNVVITA